MGLIEEAAEQYHKAATAGYAKAQNNYGRMLELGLGLEKNTFTYITFIYFSIKTADIGWVLLSFRSFFVKNSVQMDWLKHFNLKKVWE